MPTSSAPKMMKIPAPVRRQIRLSIVSRMLINYRAWQDNKGTDVGEAAKAALANDNYYLANYQIRMYAGTLPW